MPIRTNHPEPSQPEGQTRPFGQLAGLLKPYTIRLVVVVLLLTGLALVNMAIPASIGIIFNEVFPNRLTWLLWALLPGILVVYLLRNVLFAGTKAITMHIGEQICFHLRRRLFQRLQVQNLPFYRDHHPGELSSRVMDDTFTVQTFVQDDVPKLLQAVCLFVSLVVVLYVINWRLGVVTTLVLPLHIVVFRYFRQNIKQTSQAVQESLASVHGNLVEKFLGMDVVQGFTGEDRENEAFVRAIDRSRESQLASKKLHVLQKITADVLIGLGTVALLGFGGYEVMKDSASAMQPGTFVAYFGFVGMLYPTVTVLMGALARMVRAGASLDRIEQMLTPDPAESAFTDVSRGPVLGHLSFFWVSVRYGSGPEVLKDITLEIPKGTFCIIRGPSGSGKTVLVSLVARFIAPSHGRILLDATDLVTADVKRLRESIGIAFQECFLFNATLLENLRYAKPNATIDQINRVATITGVDELIRRLPDGYETLLGEHGWNLARGEKQKVALARALLKEPRILIMDEATASIDVAAEQKIISAIQEFMIGKTTLMVTHQPDLLKFADMVVALDKGRLVYHGSPGQMPPDTDSELAMKPGIVVNTARIPAPATAHRG